MENENEVSAEELIEKTPTDISEAAADNKDENIQKSTENEPEIAVEADTATADADEGTADDENQQMPTDKEISEGNEIEREDDVSENNGKQCADQQEEAPEPQEDSECRTSTPLPPALDDDALQSDEIDTATDGTLPIPESTPEKVRMDTSAKDDLLTIVSSPSENEMDDSANHEKSWSHQSELNASMSEDIYDDHSGDELMDEEELDDSDDDVRIGKNRQNSSANQKADDDCQVFDIDDNSDVEERPSMTDDDDDNDDIEDRRMPYRKPGPARHTEKRNTDNRSFEEDSEDENSDDIEEEEDDDDNSSVQSVHNIDDSDDEPTPVTSAKQKPSPSRHSYDITESSEQNRSEKSSIHQDDNIIVVRRHIKNGLRKQGVLSLHRYNTLKRSVNYLNRKMRNSCGTSVGSSSNLNRKSASIDVSVLKERNSKETIDASKSSNDESSSHKEAKQLKMVDCRSTAQSASNSEISAKKASHHQQLNENKSSEILDLDDDLDDYENIDDSEKRAKGMTSEGENDSQNAIGMDVDEPSEDLYVAEKASNQYKRSEYTNAQKNTEKNNEPVTIDSDDESESKEKADEPNEVLVNGIKSAPLSDTDQAESSETDAIRTKPLDDKLSAISKKRKISFSGSESENQEPPAKNPRTEIESHFSRHDKMIRRAINSSTSASTNDPDNIQNDIDQLNLEIEALSDAARTKEIEWNNILYLKKMKEDILQRLTRKKTVVEILSSKSIDNPESLYSNNGSFENLPDLNANEAKKPSANTITPTTSFIMSRCNMKSVDLAKEKSNLNELHRNTQPKSTTPSFRTEASATFANVVTSIPKSSPAIQTQAQSFLQQRFRENGQNLLNAVGLDQPSNKMQIGRQGQIKDVQSIIANFRQTHPEIVPRRGRRLKNVNHNLYMNEHGNSSVGDSNDALVADMLAKHNNDISSPPSSNDSNYSNSHVLLSKAGASNLYGSISGNFKQAFNENNLAASMNMKNNNLHALTSTPLFKNQATGIGYPEVTLHPIQSGHSSMNNNQKHTNDNLSDAHNNSLLHGILTKSTKQKGSSTITSGLGSTTNNAAAGFNAYSPTLARLLTAPERNFQFPALSTNNVHNNNNNNSNNNNMSNNNNNNNNFFTNQSSGINLSKSNSARSQQDTNKPEISCLPITQILAFQQQQQQQLQQTNSLLQQQLQRHQRDINKYLPKNNALFNLDDEADDSDRLVIDEGDQYSNSDMIGGPSGKDESHEGDLPECQGCKKREAQFVCADCQRQWYCSRECQVMAWDEHSEVCAR